MRENGFLDREITVKDIITGKKADGFIKATANDNVGDIFTKMREDEISQIPVFEGDKLVGTLDEKVILSALINNEVTKSDNVSSLITQPLPVVEESTSLKEVVRLMSNGNNAVLAMDRSGSYYVISNYDILQKI